MILPESHASVIRVLLVNQLVHGYSTYQEITNFINNEMTI